FVQTATCIRANSIKACYYVSCNKNRPQNNSFPRFESTVWQFWLNNPGKVSLPPSLVVARSWLEWDYFKCLSNQSRFRVMQSTSNLGSSIPWGVRGETTILTGQPWRLRGL